LKNYAVPTEPGRYIGSLNNILNRRIGLAGIGKKEER
jgi:hypothetical protein